MNFFRAQAVIFDLDGVLVDSEPLYFKALNYVLQANSAAPLKDEENRGLIGTTVEHTWNAIMKMRSLPLPLEYYIARYSERVAQDIESDMEVVAGATIIIKQARAEDIPIAVASSSFRKWVDQKLRVIGLGDQFDFVIAGDEIERGKPAPDIYLEAANRLAVPPGRCLAIEDSPSGISAAVAAGMYVVGVRTAATSGLDISSAHQVIDSLEDFDMGLLGRPQPSPKGNVTTEAR